MSARTKTINVTIMDKEYPISCPENEEAALMESVQYLNNAISGIRNAGRTIGSERIITMAALNLAHELIQTKKSNNLITA